MSDVDLTFQSSQRRERLGAMADQADVAERLTLISSGPGHPELRLCSRPRCPTVAQNSKSQTLPMPPDPISRPFVDPAVRLVSLRCLVSYSPIGSLGAKTHVCSFRQVLVIESKHRAHARHIVRSTCGLKRPSLPDATSVFCLHHPRLLSLQ